jgi:putative iron-dependent peroxidase
VAAPQNGIFALGTTSHTYLELDLRPGVRPASLVRVMAGLREPRRTMGGVNLVTGFRPELWAAVQPADAPRGLTGFNAPRTGPQGKTLPATQHDAVLWIAGAAYDAVFDLARGIVAALASKATLANEIVGWPYHADLDLTGFIDGIENPPLAEAAQETVIAEGLPGEGGTVLLLQMWQHDGMGWESLPVHEREAAIGRRRHAPGAELDPLPASSHVARTNQDTFGQIFRRNVAYGNLTNHGTVFVGFSRDRERLDAMLDSMIGADGSDHDRLTDFTHAITGAYYFVPANEALAACAAHP